jgi:hypothetical protein
MRLLKKPPANPSGPGSAHSSRTSAATTTMDRKHGPPAALGDLERRSTELINGPAAGPEKAMAITAMRNGSAARTRSASWRQHRCRQRRARAGHRQPWWRIWRTFRTINGALRRTGSPRARPSAQDCHRRTSGGTSGWRHVRVEGPPVSVYTISNTFSTTIAVLMVTVTREPGSWAR